MAFTVNQDFCSVKDSATDLLGPHSKSYKWDYRSIVP